jgi:hypothetical protein
MSVFPRPTDANAALLNQACEPLLSEFTPDYMDAQLCDAARRTITQYVQQMT